jgi:hypothetical protein
MATCVYKRQTHRISGVSNTGQIVAGFAAGRDLSDSTAAERAHSFGAVGRAGDIFVAGHELRTRGTAEFQAVRRAPRRKNGFPGVPPGRQGVVGECGALDGKSRAQVAMDALGTAARAVASGTTALSQLSMLAEDPVAT